MKTVLIILLLVTSIRDVHGQCSALGQTPGTAFPVCGTSIFKQTTVPACMNGAIPVPDCPVNNPPYADKNPFWYKFTCFKSGTLSFLITPNNAGDDYDWQLFDVTGHDPSEVYGNSSLIVAGNWAGTYGRTGASASGVNFTQCGSDPKENKPSYAKSPSLLQGHQYLLLVSHFTDSQSGYSLTFGGGTAVITDPKSPELEQATARCDGSQVYVKLNKRMRRSSLSPDGSEFTLLPAMASVKAAAIPGQGFDMDSLVLTLNNPIPPGDYQLVMRKGVDDNTLLDNCDAAIPEGDQLNFTLLPVSPTPMQAILPPGCAPDKIRVTFGTPIRCSSIAGNGSDFNLTGTLPMAITGAKGINCVNGITSTIEIQFSGPIEHQGGFQLNLVQGTDGNTLINDCGVASLAGGKLPFETKDTVSAVFNYHFNYTCANYTVALEHPGGHQVDRWIWNFGPSLNSDRQEVTLLDTTFSTIPAKLIVSNGVCADTTSVDLVPDKAHQLIARFEAPAFLCPTDKAIFINKSVGNIISWDWNFGNGESSILQTPPDESYAVPVRSTDYAVMLKVENNFGCKDTMTQRIKVINNCFIDVPSAFTPNNDGMNDYLYPLNAYKAVDLEFRIFNRYGQLVFETRDWTRKWDGTVNGTPQDAGAYVWMLSFTDQDSGEKIFKKGSTLLIR